MERRGVGRCWVGLGWDRLTYPPGLLIWYEVRGSVDPETLVLLIKSAWIRKDRPLIMTRGETSARCSVLVMWSSDVVNSASTHFFTQDQEWSLVDANTIL